MPIVLDTSQRAVLIAAIVDTLPRLKVTYGKFIDGLDLLAEAVMRALPKSEKARKNTGVAELRADVIPRFFAEQLEALLPGEFESEPNARQLTDIDGFATTADLASAAEKVVTAFMTLPWAYVLVARTPLPVAVCEGVPEIALDDVYSLRRFDSASADSMPVHETSPISLPLFNQAYPEKIDSDHYYFAREIFGYITSRDALEVEAFVDAGKGFLGLSSITGALAWKARWWGRPAPAEPVVIYRKNADALTLLPYHWLSSDDSDLLARLHPPENESIASLLPVIRSAFRHEQTRSAARWYVDSFTGSNGLLQTVQATIAVEILLGDREEAEQIGLTALLANRLAFMIGGSPTYRATVLQRFKHLYNIRSQIVHRGKAVLTAEERDALYEIRELARQAILTQTRQLYRESHTGTGS